MILNNVKMVNGKSLSKEEKSSLDLDSNVKGLTAVEVYNPLYRKVVPINGLWNYINKGG